MRVRLRRSERRTALSRRRPHPAGPHTVGHEALRFACGLQSAFSFSDRRPELRRGRTATRSAPARLYWRAALRARPRYWGPLL